MSENAVPVLKEGSHSRASFPSVERTGVGLAFSLRVELFSKIPKPQRVTMIFDNDKEFSSHKELAETLELSYYFANPEHSRERELDEHINGLIRHFFQTDKF